MRTTLFLSEFGCRNQYCFAVSQNPTNCRFIRGNQLNIMGYTMRTDTFRYTLWVDHNPATGISNFDNVTARELCVTRVSLGHCRVAIQPRSSNKTRFVSVPCACDWCTGTRMRWNPFRCRGRRITTTLSTTHSKCLVHGERTEYASKDG